MWSKTALAAHGLEAEFRPIAVSPVQVAPTGHHCGAAHQERRAGRASTRADSDVIIEIPDCLLLHPDLMGAIPVAENAWRSVGASRKSSLDVSATAVPCGAWISR